LSALMCFATVLQFSDSVQKPTLSNSLSLSHTHTHTHTHTHSNLFLHQNDLPTLSQSMD
jgi:hypothetical protein